MNHTPTRATLHRYVAALLVALGLVFGGAFPARAFADVPMPPLTGMDSVFLTKTSGALAPGLNLTSFQRLQPEGWVTGHVMTADLAEPTLSMDVVDGGTVSGTGTTVSQLARQSGAVAAVNGDYFDMNYSNAPVGTDVSPQQGVRTVTNATRESLTVAQGIAAIQRLTSGSTVTVGGAAQPIEAVNSPNWGTNQLGLYTSAWGAYPLSRFLASGESFTAVTVASGKVAATTSDRAQLDKSVPLPQGSEILLARGTAQARIKALTVGAAAPVEIRTSAPVDLAVGGNERLVINGVAGTASQTAAARTAVGLSKDGTKLYVVSIEGRQGDAHGMSMTELTRFMLELGAYNALNLDGGGSSDLVARMPGDSDVSVVNRPSDGNERLVANALVFKTSAPATLSSLQVKPAIAGGDTLMPGLTRTLEGTGLSTALGPVRVNGHFQAQGSAVKLAKGDGEHAVATGERTGPAQITYQAGGLRASTALTVLGPVARIAADKQLVSLANGTETATVKLTAFDAEERTTPIETRDVQVKVDGDATVKASGLDSFLITPTTGSGSATITFTAAGKSVVVPVTIGTKAVDVATFADAAQWKSAADRATGTLSPAVGPNGEPAMRLQYDFTQSTATRGFYAVPPAPILIPGQPQKLTLWVKGDGSGAWPRLQVLKGDGVVTNLNGPTIDFKGWQQISFDVPAGTPYPLTLQRIRFLETRSNVKYKGDITISGLQALVPVDVALPAPVSLHDPVSIANGTVDGRPQRIAIMSDAQFTADNPASDYVAAARRTLREILAAKPDYLFIDGDFVDRGFPQDIALAKRILDEEIGDKLPYTYVPGNHEMYGSNTTANFSAVFGPTHTVHDIAGTRFITLDSATGTLHPGGSTEQLQFFEQQLADAATNPAISGVVVLEHHPVNDPLEDKNSQLGDRYEAQAFLDDMVNFRDTAHKSIANVNGHVGVFNGSVNQGVSVIINGNSGKSPASTPDKGGFTGWTMLGIDPNQGTLPANPTTLDRLQWLRAETHARVDDLVLDAPTAMNAGDIVDVTATVTQDGQKVPVVWPVSALWSGQNVHIVPSMDQPGATNNARMPVEFDPETRQLKAIAPGTATLTITVNGVSRSVTITVS